MHRIHPARLTAIAAACSALVLTGCARNEPAQPKPGAGQTTAGESTTTETSTEVSTSPETSSTAASGTSTSSRGERSQNKQLVDDVSKRFSTLAPASLFAQLETCSQTDMAGSYDCSGPEIGQFQLFDSDAKAASTTQLLTELRSSRIVEDNGTRVVGWSTLGTSAIITVVDNEKGQVLQQLISSDQEDPRERIHKLGLSQSAEPTSGEATATGSTTPRATAAEKPAS
ncbi:hypothetical protein [Corynebacterium sp. UBA2622]|uniref:hypothetical protein n=1 Tax=Corynebacterium sp. UBA2622 TaxID=1946393 RepID=UPI0025B7BC32|nr:hypothetical protein [Corynebacterium sp. UBA2622]